jgi:hypothetical protein
LLVAAGQRRKSGRDAAAKLVYLPKRGVAIGEGSAEWDFRLGLREKT